MQTEEQTALRPSLTAEITTRLQQLVAGWQGAERNQPLTDLHNECLNAAGPGGCHLLPARLLLVKNLDETQLQAALRGLNGKARGTQLRFRVRPVGRFDSVLVPVGPVGEPPNSWLLAIEETLSISDQVALYAHALGHLLLNNDLVKMGRLPDPDPKVGYAHSDMLAELRMLETIRQPLDRRVLETYPLLTDLLGVRDEPAAVLDLVAYDLRRRLAQFGWRGQQFVETPYIFTNGRVSIRESSPQHGKKLRLDALLRAEASLPIAAVQTIHAGEGREDVIQRLKEYAHNRLAVPFAYLFEDDGTIHEFDWSASETPVHSVLTVLPTREALWNRWTEALGLTDKQARDALQYPYQLSRPKPRYYQEAAINRAVIAVLQAKRDLREPRILLTLATGTGKTKIAFQLVWKLKKARAIRNVLYLTDRDWLLSQAMDNDFAPFGDARQRILGEAKTSRDIVFATYQAVADNEARAGLYRDFPRGFFDVIIVDECHRGSAQDDSRWRTILEETSAALRTRTRAIARHLATYMQQTDPLAKTIVFCVDQYHAEKMREALEAVCSENVMRYRGYIERIVSEEGMEGKRALGRFSTPDERTPVIVTTSRLLSTGVDVPTCKNIVLARPVGSLVEFKQIIGRGSRLYEPDKTWFTIIDYAGAIKLFFDPNFDGDPELVEVEPLVPHVVETGTHAIIKEDTIISLEGQHFVDVPVPLPTASLVSPVPEASPEEYAQQQAIAATPPSELAPVEAEPPIPGGTPFIPQFSETENAPVTAQSPIHGGDSTETPVSEPVSKPSPVVRQTRSGHTIQVIGEYVYDLGPDGKTLISRSFYRDYTASTLKGIVQAPADLRARWLSREQRETLLGQLEEEGVDLRALAAALHHPDVDPLDLLLHVAFGQDMPTRSDRVERLYHDHADFFKRYSSEARETLNVILDKYIAGEASDISNTKLFDVPPLKDRGTFIELAKPFGGGSKVRIALKKLQALLYSA